MEVQQVLLATDLSDHARGAYGGAAKLASKLGANLHLVHFAGAIPSLRPRTSRETLLDTLKRDIEDESNEHSAFVGIEVRPHLQHHHWTRSRQWAFERELDIDLIVMSPQWQTGLAKILLGSFADRVVRHSSVPVLHFRQTESAGTLHPKTILVPHDFCDGPETVVSTMQWLDRHYTCVFRPFHVYTPSWANAQSVRGTEHHIARAMKGSRAILVEERFVKLVHEDLVGLDLTTEAAQGHPSQKVVQQANYLPADLVLVGKREGPGSVTRAVIREARCSMLTAPVIDSDDLEQTP